MSSFISNPKKEFVLPKNMVDVKNSLKDLTTYFQIIGSDNYKLESYNDFIGELRLYTFELLSLGVIIVINTKKINDDETSINIEVQRRVGGFDRDSEISNANEHINYITEVLSSLVRNPEMDYSLAEKHGVVRKKTINNLSLILWLIFFWPYGVYRMWNEKVWSKNTRHIITITLILLTVIGLIQK